MTPAGRLSLRSLLSDALPESRFSAEHAAFAVDGVVPEVVVRPARADEVAAVLAHASSAAAAVIPWGAGSRMALGSPPVRYDLALKIDGLNGVIEHEAGDLTVTAEAGIRLADLQDRLASANQWLPLDPAAGTTLGGIIATNASGPSRMTYGTVRDLLLGLEIATPAGDLQHFGGRVVKNVAGYDMSKLHVGALGGLGVITKATLKVLPLSRKRESLRLQGQLVDIMSISTLLASSRSAIEGLTVTAQSEAAFLELRLAGGEAAVQRSRDLIERTSALHAITPAAEILNLDIPEHLVVRLGVVPSETRHFCQALVSLGATLQAYPTAGVVVGAWGQNDAPPLARLQSLRAEAIAQGQGALVIEKAPLEVKETLGVWGEPRGDFRLMQQLKRRFDPGSLLSPGRYLGGL